MPHPVDFTRFDDGSSCRGLCAWRSGDAVVVGVEEWREGRWCVVDQEALALYVPEAPGIHGARVAGPALLRLASAWDVPLHVVCGMAGLLGIDQGDD